MHSKDKLKEYLSIISNYIIEKTNLVINFLKNFIKNFKSEIKNISIIYSHYSPIIKKEKEEISSLNINLNSLKKKNLNLTNQINTEKKEILLLSNTIDDLRSFINPSHL